MSFLHKITKGPLPSQQNRGTNPLLHKNDRLAATTSSLDSFAIDDPDTTADTNSNGKLPVTFWENSATTHKPNNDPDSAYQDYQKLIEGLLSNSWQLRPSEETIPNVHIPFSQQLSELFAPPTTASSPVSPIRARIDLLEFSKADPFDTVPPHSSKTANDLISDTELLNTIYADFVSANYAQNKIIYNTLSLVTYYEFTARRLIRNPDIEEKDLKKYQKGLKAIKQIESKANQSLKIPSANFNKTSDQLIESLNNDLEKYFPEIPLELNIAALLEDAANTLKKEWSQFYYDSYLISDCPPPENADGDIPIGLRWEIPPIFNLKAQQTLFEYILDINHKHPGQSQSLKEYLEEIIKKQTDKIQKNESDYFDPFLLKDGASEDDYSISHGFHYDYYQIQSYPSKEILQSKANLLLTNLQTADHEQKRYYLMDETRALLMERFKSEAAAIKSGSSPYSLPELDTLRMMNVNEEQLSNLRRNPSLQSEYLNIIRSNSSRSFLTDSELCCEAASGLISPEILCSIFSNSFSNEANKFNEATQQQEMRFFEAYYDLLLQEEKNLFTPPLQPEISQFDIEFVRQRYQMTIDIVGLIRQQMATHTWADFTASIEGKLKTFMLGSKNEDLKDVITAVSQLRSGAQNYTTSVQNWQNYQELKKLFIQSDPSLFAAVILQRFLEGTTNASDFYSAINSEFSTNEHSVLESLLSNDALKEIDAIESKALYALGPENASKFCNRLRYAFYYIKFKLEHDRLLDEKMGKINSEEMVQKGWQTLSQFQDISSESDKSADNLINKIEAMLTKKDFLIRYQGLFSTYMSKNEDWLAIYQSYVDNLQQVTNDPSSLFETNLAVISTLGIFDSKLLEKVESRFKSEGDSSFQFTTIVKGDLTQWLDILEQGWPNPDGQQGQSAKNRTGGVNPDKTFQPNGNYYLTQQQFLDCFLPDSQESAESRITRLTLFFTDYDMGYYRFFCPYAFEKNADGLQIKAVRDHTLYLQLSLVLKDINAYAQAFLQQQDLSPEAREYYEEVAEVAKGLADNFEIFLEQPLQMPFWLVVNDATNAIEKLVPHELIQNPIVSNFKNEIEDLNKSVHHIIFNAQNYPFMGLSDQMDQHKIFSYFQKSSTQINFLPRDFENLTIDDVTSIQENLLDIFANRDGDINEINLYLNNIIELRDQEEKVEWQSKEELSDHIFELLHDANLYENNKTFFDKQLNLIPTSKKAYLTTLLAAKADLLEYGAPQEELKRITYGLNTELLLLISPAISVFIPNITDKQYIVTALTRFTPTERSSAIATLRDKMGIEFSSDTPDSEQLNRKLVELVYSDNLYAENKDLFDKIFSDLDKKYYESDLIAEDLLTSQEVLTLSEYYQKANELGMSEADFDPKELVSNNLLLLSLLNPIFSPLQLGSLCPTVNLDYQNISSDQIYKLQTDLASLIGPANFQSSKLQLQRAMETWHDQRIKLEITKEQYQTGICVILNSWSKREDLYENYQTIWQRSLSPDQNSEIEELNHKLENLQESQKEIQQTPLSGSSFYEEINEDISQQISKTLIRRNRILIRSIDPRFYCEQFGSLEEINPNPQWLTFEHTLSALPQYSNLDFMDWYLDTASNDEITYLLGRCYDVANPQNNNSNLQQRFKEIHDSISTLQIYDLYYLAGYKTYFMEGKTIAIPDQPDFIEQGQRFADTFSPAETLWVPALIRQNLRAYERDAKGSEGNIFFEHIRQTDIDRYINTLDPNQAQILISKLIKNYAASKDIDPNSPPLLSDLDYRQAGLIQNSIHAPYEAGKTIERRYKIVSTFTPVFEMNPAEQYYILIKIAGLMNPDLPTDILKSFEYGISLSNYPLNKEECETFLTRLVSTSPTPNEMKDFYRILFGSLDSEYRNSAYHFAKEFYQNNSFFTNEEKPESENMDPFWPFLSETLEECKKFEFIDPEQNISEEHRIDLLNRLDQAITASLGYDENHQRIPLDLATNLLLEKYFTDIEIAIQESDPDNIDLQKVASTIRFYKQALFERFDAENTEQRALHSQYNIHAYYPHAPQFSLDSLYTFEHYEELRNERSLPSSPDSQAQNNIDNILQTMLHVMEDEEDLPEAEVSILDQWNSYQAISDIDEIFDDLSIETDEYFRIHEPNLRDQAKMKLDYLRKKIKSRYLETFTEYKLIELQDIWAYEQTDGKTGILTTLLKSSEELTNKQKRQSEIYRNEISDLIEQLEENGDFLTQTQENYHDKLIETAKLELILTSSSNEKDQITFRSRKYPTYDQIPALFLSEINSFGLDNSAELNNLKALLIQVFFSEQNFTQLNIHPVPADLKFTLSVVDISSLYQLLILISKLRSLSDNCYKFNSPQFLAYSEIIDRLTATQEMILEEIKSRRIKYKSTHPKSNNVRTRISVNKIFSHSNPLQ